MAEARQVQDGTYIVKINRIRTEYMAKEFMEVLFEITDENSEDFGKRIIMKQYVNSDYGFRLAKEFLTSLDCTTIDISNLDELAQIMPEIYEKTRLMEFDLEQTTTNNIFKNFKIKGIYDLVEI